jgi:hypothetical protein
MTFVGVTKQNAAPLSPRRDFHLIYRRSVLGFDGRVFGVMVVIFMR